MDGRHRASKENVKYEFIRSRGLLKVRAAEKAAGEATLLLSQSQGPRVPAVS